MVPITIVAFLLGALTLQRGDQARILSFGKYDVWGLIIVSIGVFMQNWFAEKPQVTSIEEDEADFQDPASDPKY